MRASLRALFLSLSLLLCPIVAPHAAVSISIGINVPAYPSLIQVPGLPVYYGPHLNLNYFFYDGEYWVFQDDRWYASTWYNGPWTLIDADDVPLFLLRVPVRYYRHPPVFFRGWSLNQPPRWDDHWGHEWEQRHRDWNRWNRRTAPRPAPLPRYQRSYTGDRYPREEMRQNEIRSQNYRYVPHENTTRQRIQQQPPESRSRNQPTQPAAPSRDRDQRKDKEREHR